LRSQNGDLLVVVESKQPVVVAIPELISFSLSGAAEMLTAIDTIIKIKVEAIINFIFKY
jgi:hypothetical protein